MWAICIVSTCLRSKLHDRNTQVRVSQVQVKCNSSEVAQRGVQLFKKGSKAWSWLFVSMVQGINK